MRVVEGVRVMEDCPASRLDTPDIGGWDAWELCGLFECPGCELTPDHPLMLGEPLPVGEPWGGEPLSPEEWDIPF